MSEAFCIIVGSFGGKVEHFWSPMASLGLPMGPHGPPLVPFGSSGMSPGEPLGPPGVALGCHWLVFGPFLESKAEPKYVQNPYHKSDLILVRL